MIQWAKQAFVGTVVLFVYLYIYILKAADVVLFLGVCEHRVAFSHFELAVHQVYMTTTGS